MQDEVPGAFLIASPFPAPNHPVTGGRFMAVTEAFYPTHGRRSMEGPESQGGQPYSGKNDPIQPSLTERGGESEDPTQRCRIFIIRDPFCDFKSFSVTEVTKEICMHIHTGTQSYTQSYTGIDMNRHIVTDSQSHIQVAHIQNYTQSCVQIYTHHMCTQTAHHTLVHTHTGAHKDRRQPETCLSHAFFLCFYNLHPASQS